MLLWPEDGTEAHDAEVDFLRKDASGELLPGRKGFPLEQFNNLSVKKGNL